MSEELSGKAWLLLLSDCFPSTKCSGRDDEKTAVFLCLPRHHRGVQDSEEVPERSARRPRPAGGRGGEGQRGAPPPQAVPELQQTGGQEVGRLSHLLQPVRQVAQTGQSQSHSVLRRISTPALSPGQDHRRANSDHSGHDHHVETNVQNKPLDEFLLLAQVHRGDLGSPQVCR